eukprot:3026182-Ditylum_brightwellii.AAC.2
MEEALLLAAVLEVLPRTYGSGTDSSSFCGRNSPSSSSSYESGGSSFMGVVIDPMEVVIPPMDPPFPMDHYPPTVVAVGTAMAPSPTEVAE